MVILASVLAGQGVARFVEMFGASDAVAGVSAVIAAPLITIGLFVWKRRG